MLIIFTLQRRQVNTPTFYLCICVWLCVCVQKKKGVGGCDGIQSTE